MYNPPSRDDPGRSTEVSGALIGKGQMGSASHGVTADFMSFDGGAFGVLPLTYCYLPKSARAPLFPQAVKINYFCSGPISVDPISPQPTDAFKVGVLLLFVLLLFI